MKIEPATELDHRLFILARLEHKATGDTKQADKATRALDRIGERIAELEGEAERLRTRLRINADHMRRLLHATARQTNGSKRTVHDHNGTLAAYVADAWGFDNSADPVCLAMTEALRSSGWIGMTNQGKVWEIDAPYGDVWDAWELACAVAQVVEA
jgi:hypothetical protein